MTTRYIVSKTSFFHLLASADGMLESLGLFASPIPFSHRYYIFCIKRFAKNDPQQWLKQTFISNHANWMARLQNEPCSAEAPVPQSTRADVVTSIQTAQFIKADRFIKAQLDIGIRHLFPEQMLQQRLAQSNWEAAWKVADQLMFMCDDWKMQHPAWIISLKTARNQCHIMAVQLKYGMVVIQFYYPIGDCALQKDHPMTLLKPPNFH